MAQYRNSRDDDFRGRKDQQHLSRSSDAADKIDEEWEELEISTSKSVGMAGAIKKFKHMRWLKKNPTLVKGIAVGVFLLLVMLFFGWQLGWFSSDQPQAPAIAAQPQPPMSSPAQATPLEEPSKLPGQNLPRNRSRKNLRKSQNLRCPTTWPSGRRRTTSARRENDRSCWRRWFAWVRKLAARRRPKD